MFKDNHTKYGGRQKGSANQFTQLKDQFLKAFNEVGGYQYLVDFAKDKKNKKDFLMIISRMLPKDITVDTNSALSITINTKQIDKGDTTKQLTK